MRHVPWKETGWAFAVVCGLLVLYVLAYWLLVLRGTVHVDDGGGVSFDFPDIACAVKTPDVDPRPRPSDSVTFKNIATSIAAVEDYGPPERWYRVNPHYRFGGDFAKQFFAPIHEVDVGLRYTMWHFPMRWSF